MADSTMEDHEKLKCLIADSAAFIKNVDLQNLSERVFTITEVISEIKDSNTRQRLAVLPYEICFREPSTESINFVTQFSKKTGDFKSLSAVDLRVLALSYQLEKEFGSLDNIRNEPSRKTEVVGKDKVHLDKNIAGFYSMKKNTSESGGNNQNIEVEMTDDTTDDHKIKMTERKNYEINNLKTTEEQQAGEKTAEQGIDNNNKTVKFDSCREMETEPDGDEIDDDDDNEGWITPGNIKKIKEEMGINDEILIKDARIQCACLTTDFAMQNVLIQMGLHVLSVKGMLIRQARSFIQKCFGCNKETHDMEKIFCPVCGNKTLMKISVTVNEDGTIQYHLPKRRKNINTRGTKYSLPNPKGGRRSEQPLLVEDQKSNQTRLPKKKDQINPLDPDYTSWSNPFAQNDINSRAVYLNLHVKSRQPRNPNESKKHKSGRKKR